MLHIASRLLTCVAVLMVIGCSKPTSSPERLVEAAFDAIKAKDWKAYAPLIITSADIMLAQDKVAPIKRKLTYTGEVLKPEELRLHRVDFDKAAGGGTDMIDFRQTAFDRAVMVASTQQELLNGNNVQITFYGVAVKGGNGQVSQLDPGFSVVPWGDGYRLLRLNFRDPGAVEQK